MSTLELIKLRLTCLFFKIGPHKVKRRLVVDMNGASSSVHAAQLFLNQRTIVQFIVPSRFQVLSVQQPVLIVKSTSDEAALEKSVDP